MDVLFWHARYVICTTVHELMCTAMLASRLPAYAMCYIYTRRHAARRATRALRRAAIWAWGLAWPGGGGTMHSSCMCMCTHHVRAGWLMVTVSDCQITKKSHTYMSHTTTHTHIHASSYRHPQKKAREKKRRASSRAKEKRKRCLWLLATTAYCVLTHSNAMCHGHGHGLEGTGTDPPHTRRLSSCLSL
jgi:hypothetical protein